MLYADQAAPRLLYRMKDTVHIIKLFYKLMVTFLVWPLLEVTVSACSIFGRPFCINPSLESLVLVTFCSVLFTVSLSFFLVTLLFSIAFFVFSAFGQSFFSGHCFWLVLLSGHCLFLDVCFWSLVSDSLFFSGHYF